MTLTSQQRALLASRAGVARVGAVRVGFCPLWTHGLPGTALGTGGFYIWRAVYPADYAWTAVVR